MGGEADQDFWRGVNKVDLTDPLFTEVSRPVDWCTVRGAWQQRQMHEPKKIENHVEHDDGNASTNDKPEVIFP